MRRVGRRRTSPRWRGCRGRRWICGIAGMTPTASPGCWTGPGGGAGAGSGRRSGRGSWRRPGPARRLETGLSHWSSREMAAFIKRTEGMYVSHHYVAKLWRETGLKPHRQGTFKVSKDPAFAEKVADVVGLYLDPPGGAVVLSIDEKTQIQALDRTQPVLPIDFDGDREAHPRLRPARHHEPVRRAERRHRRGVRRVQADPQRRRLPGLPEEGGQTARRQGDPRRAGQPVHPHHPGGQGVAGARTRTSTSISPRSARRGSTRSRPGSASSPGSRSAAAPSPPSRS